MSGLFILALIYYLGKFLQLIATMIYYDKKYQGAIDGWK